MKPSLRKAVSEILHLGIIAIGIASVMLYLMDRKARDLRDQKIELAMSAADAGVWYWDIAEDHLVWDERMFKLFGRERVDWTPNYQGFESALHLEDRERVITLVNGAIKARSGYQAIFRVITGDSKVVEIRAAGKVSKNGRYMTGICLPAVHIEGIYKAASVGGYPWTSSG